MPVTPTGPISLPLSHLRTLLAASTTFQTWVDADDATEALDSIHLVSLPAPESGEAEFTAAELSALRPLAIVDLFEVDDRMGLQAFVADKRADRVFQDSGKLILTLEADIDAEHLDDADAKIDFLNRIRAIVEEMEALAGTNEYLTIHRIEILTSPMRNDQTVAAAQGNFYRIRLLINHGIQGREAVAPKVHGSATTKRLRRDGYT